MNLTEPSPPVTRHIGRLLGLTWRYRTPCLLVVTLHVMLVALTVGGLRLAGLGIDIVRYHFNPNGNQPQWPLGLQPPSDWSTMWLLATAAAGILLVAFGVAFLKFAAAVASARLSQRVLVQLRTDVYDKLQRLSFHFFDNVETSSLINRAAGDVQAVRTFVDGVIVKMLVVLLSLGVYLIYMFSVHAMLTFACLVSTPFLCIGAVLFSRRVQSEYRHSAELGDRLITTLAENIQGIHVVKGFAREDQEIARFEQVNREVRDQKQRIFWKVSTYQPLMGLLTQVNMLILIGYGGHLVVRGELPLGAGMFVLANLLHEFANQVGQITNIANTIQSSLTGAERVFEILDTPIDIDSPSNAVRLPPIAPSTTELPHVTPSAPADEFPTTAARARSITFERATFAYQNGRNGDTHPAANTPNGVPVLDEMTLRIRSGESVGIVGETGAGKSTLLSLVPRFYNLSDGTLSVDGHDVRSLDVQELRQNIGIVFQETFLFSNTVAANIAFGHPVATAEVIERAARIAAADEFIRELPQGYATVIGEHGSNLSGGQRQRIAIARALLLDPPILLLDDATASVDAHTEHEIQQAMHSAMRGRTTLFVSNRISTLRRADRIVVLQNGRIIQNGTHDELLAVEGYYSRLAELQFADLSNGVVVSP